MDTALNKKTGVSENIKESMLSMFYVSVGLAALAKEKIDEWIEEAKTHKPEVRENGERIINETVAKVKGKADQLKTDAEDMMAKGRAKVEGFMGKHTEEKDPTEKHTYNGVEGNEKPIGFQAQRTDHKHENHYQQNPRNNQNPLVNAPNRQNIGVHTQHK